MSKLNNVLTKLLQQQVGDISSLGNPTDLEEGKKSITGRLAKIF